MHSYLPRVLGYIPGETWVHSNVLRPRLSLCGWKSSFDKTVISVFKPLTKQTAVTSPDSRIMSYEGWEKKTNLSKALYQNTNKAHRTKQKSSQPALICRKPGRLLILGRSFPPNAMFSKSLRLIQNWKSPCQREHLKFLFSQLPPLVQGYPLGSQPVTTSRRQTRAR